MAEAGGAFVTRSFERMLKEASHRNKKYATLQQALKAYLGNDHRNFYTYIEPSLSHKTFLSGIYLYICMHGLRLPACLLNCSIPFQHHHNLTACILCIYGAFLIADRTRNPGVPVPSSGQAEESVPSDDRY